MSKKKERKHQRVQPISIPIHDLTVALLPEFVRRTERRPKEEAPKSGLSKGEFKAIANIATNAWRAKIKMMDPDTGEAKEEMKRVYRHIEAIFEALKQIDIEITDPVGRTYDAGMALKVVASEPTPGISKETVKETIKPTILWRGHFLQIGEVIVGTPQVP